MTSTADPSRSSERRNRLRVLVSCLALLGIMAAASWLVLRITGRAITKVELYSEQLERVAPPEWAPASSALELATASRPKNIILFIADGLGFAHLAAGRAARHGIDGGAIWDRFSAVGWHRPHPVDGFLTDSAASATALATGQATRNGFVGMDAGGKALTTLFERASEWGYRTGLVTDSYIWDATPASFVAHVTDRDLASEILEQLAAADLDLLFGELEDVGEGEVPDGSATETLFAERYTVFGPEPITVEQILTADVDRPVVAIFEEDQLTDLSSTPNLPLLTRAALGRLAAPGEPFVLLVESEELDSASHRRDFARVLRGLEAIEATLALLLDFAASNGDTLVLFTSDHETGALSLSTERGNLALRALWGSNSHTGVAVPLMALGPGSELFSGMHANWQVGRLLHSLLTPRPAGAAGLNL